MAPIPREPRPPPAPTIRAIDLRTLDRHPLASLRTLGALAALRLVSGFGADADAEAGWAVCAPAGKTGRICLNTYLFAITY
jgi:hypothetical protein